MDINNMRRNDVWLELMLRELNFPDEVRSSDIMIDGKPVDLNKLLSAMKVQPYYLDKRLREKKNGRLLLVWRKQTACLSKMSEA